MNTEKLTPAQIEEHKAKHGRVFLFEVEETGKWCLLRLPKRKDLSAATAAMGKNPMKFTEVLIRACFLAGDNPMNEMDEVDGFFMSVSSKIDELVKIKDGELKEL